MKTINVGHIGWLKTDDEPYCKTVAWCDINEKKIESAKTKHPDITMYTDYREMLKHPGLDAVAISTPNFVHAEQAIAFMEAGVDVFLEKPMGINQKECDAILQASEKTKKRCVIDFELRIAPFAQRLKALVDSGEYGELRHIEFVHHRGGWLASGNGLWRVDPGKSGGLYFMEPIHEVDLFRYIGGEIDSVQTIAAPTVMPHYQFQDNCCSHFFFKSGALGTILTSHTHSAVTKDTEMWSKLGHDMNFYLTMTRGSIGVDMINCRILTNRYEEYPVGSGGYQVVFDRIEDYSPIGAGSFGHDITLRRREFLRRLAAGQEPFQDTLDAWKSHRVCLAAEASLKQNSARVPVDFAR